VHSSYSAGLHLREAHCLVLGNGAEAALHIERLLAAGADVDWAFDGIPAPPPDGVKPRAQPAPEELPSYRLILAFSVPLELEAGLRAAAAAGSWVWVRDRPELSNLSLAAQLARNGVQLSLQAPAPERLLHALLERCADLLPAHLPRLLSWCAAQPALASSEAPPSLWQAVAAGQIGERVLAGRPREAGQLLAQQLRQPERAVGEIYLIGAGPGDPDLLTLRALRLLRQADVVLYDRLVAPAVLDLVPATAERVYVGKRRAHHPVPQESINALLVSYARQGKRVARLKGGDPFIFGRGGEELETLLDEGIPFQVVPGITAASGCAAYAGIPLTHRDYSQACVFVTGHRRDGRIDLDFEALARPNQTVVFYMGLQGLDELMQGLRQHGMPATTPAALVQQGTTDNQQVLVGTVSTLSGLAAARELSAPTLVIVGEVVRLREKLTWFEGDGRTVLFWDKPE
jgi:uroporphyrin-III C-methyltransferase/precorrin-2 dehydrogenase/sirohydrochlorin ferrochelatase